MEQNNEQTSPDRAAILENQKKQARKLYEQVNYTDDGIFMPDSSLYAIGWKKVMTSIEITDPDFVKDQLEHIANNRNPYNPDQQQPDIHNMIRSFASEKLTPQQ